MNHTDDCFLNIYTFKLDYNAFCKNLKRSIIKRLAIFFLLNLTKSFHSVTKKCLLPSSNVLRRSTLAFHIFASNAKSVHFQASLFVKSNHIFIYRRSSLWPINFFFHFGVIFKNGRKTCFYYVVYLGLYKSKWVI